MTPQQAQAELEDVRAILRRLEAAEETAKRLTAKLSEPMPESRTPVHA